MNQISFDHPELERLSAFALGKLAEEDSRIIELHLADCEICSLKLQDVPDDQLVHILQQVVSETRFDHPGSVTCSDLPTDEDFVCSDLLIPLELAGHSRYHVLEPLGYGGMGTVYRAQHRLMDREVAIKVINPHLLNKPGATERFVREVRGAAKLVHPNIVTAYDAEHVGSLQLLVMELINGQSLAQMLVVEHQLPVEKACDYIRQTALGLQYAFVHGMVHRDIKPQNLMLVASNDTSHPDVIKILDFGLSRFVSE